MGEAPRQGRRLAAVLRLAEVISAATQAGSFEPQLVPAHLAARLAGRVGRLQAARMAKVVPRDDLRKSLGIGLTIAGTVLPALAETQAGQRAMRWTGRKAGQAYRWATGSARGGAKVRRGMRAAGAALNSQRATLSSGMAGAGGFLIARDQYRRTDRDS